MGDFSSDQACLKVMVVKEGNYLALLQQRDLIQKVIVDEMYEALKTMPREKASGMDGFPIEFFTKK